MPRRRRTRASNPPALPRELRELRRELRRLRGLRDGPVGSPWLAAARDMYQDLEEAFEETRADVAEGRLSPHGAEVLDAFTALLRLELEVELARRARMRLEASGWSPPATVH